MPDLPEVPGLPGPHPMLLKPPEAAHTLRVSMRALWGLTKSGAIPCRRIGKCVRYVPAELDAWINQGCPTTPQEPRP